MRKRRLPHRPKLRKASVSLKKRKPKQPQLPKNERDLLRKRRLQHKLRPLKPKRRLDLRPPDELYLWVTFSEDLVENQKRDQSHRPPKRKYQSKRHRLLPHGVCQLSLVGVNYQMGSSLERSRALPTSEMAKQLRLVQCQWALLVAPLSRHPVVAGKVLVGLFC
jgi:hypothetical protein